MVSIEGEVLINKINFLKKHVLFRKAISFSCVCTVFQMPTSQQRNFKHFKHTKYQTKNFYFYRRASKLLQANLLDTAAHYDFMQTLIIYFLVDVC